MDTVMFVFILIIILATVSIVAFYGARVYIKYRGKAAVTCPETGKTVEVEVDAGHAALTLNRGIPDLRLKDCSRWPEKRDCGQECVVQLELTPEQCMVRTMLARWYEGKACIFCGKPFGEINWTDHKPALIRSEEPRTIEWGEIPTQMLPQMLKASQPVCWNCHIAESFRLEHPELVIDRPPGSAARFQA